MFSASQLSSDQKEALNRWVEEGANLSDLQKRLKEEFDVSISYMDARFMVLDLGLKLQEKQKEEEKKPEEAVPAGLGGVHVTMDHIALPGAMVSGKVTFTDGETGVWVLDQTGRPGLDLDTEGYRPTQEDILEFQTQLRELIRKSGL
jgi:hypothetical protein